MRTAIRPRRKRIVMVAAAYAALNLAAFFCVGAGLDAIGQSLDQMQLDLLQQLAAIKSLLQGFGY